MGYNFEGTLHSILNKTELNGKWELTYDGKLVITRVNAQFIEDLKFFQLYQLNLDEPPMLLKVQKEHDTQSNLGFVAVKAR